MKIKGIEVSSRTVEIEVGPRALAEALTRKIHEAAGLGLRDDLFVDDKGRIAYDEERGGGSHSWTDTIVQFKNPSPEQLDTLKFTTELRKRAYDVEKWLLSQKSTHSARVWPSPN